MSDGPATTSSGSAPGDTGSRPVAEGSALDFLPFESFVVPDHGFIVSSSQDIYVMKAAHVHSQVELNYLLEGSVTYWHGGGEAVLQAGDFAVFWGAIAHRTIQVAPGSRYVCVYLPLETFLNSALSEALRSAVIGGGFLAAARPERFDKARFERLFGDAREPVDPRMNELLCDEVVLLMRRLDVTGWRDLLEGRPLRARTAGGTMPAKVLAMIRFIAENGHRPIVVGDVARAVQLHPNYAMTRFRAALGLTIQSYILRHRLMEAQRLLLFTKKDLAALAFETGFGSLSQFHRSFQMHVGCTPAGFRRRVRVPDASASPAANG